ncbi:MAG: low molecular weight protein-tyrosine-phosphatase [Clostridia bacterium]
MTKILMICHGNICRSTMAEFVLKDMVNKEGIADEFYIESAGTSREEIGNDTHHGTKAKLKEMNISFTKRHARQVTKADYDNFDYLICMDKNNLRNLERIIGTDTENKFSLLLDFANEHKDIADPWYTGNFDETFEDVVRGCKAFLTTINKL